MEIYLQPKKVSSVISLIIVSVLFIQLENQLSTWWVSSFCLQLSLKSSSSHFYSTLFAYFHACSFPPACLPIHPPSVSSPPQSCSLQVRVSSVLLRETSGLIYSFSFKKLFSQWVLCFPGFVEKTVEWFHVALLFPLFLLVVLEFDRGWCSPAGSVVLPAPLPSICWFCFCSSFSGWCLALDFQLLRGRGNSAGGLHVFVAFSPVE